MPRSTSGSPRAIPSKQAKLLNCIAITILSLIVLVGLIVLIIWLVVRPKGLAYTIEEGSIHGYDLKDNRLNATFDFVLRSSNPNGKVSLYYDYIKVSVSYDDETIAFDLVEPFFQPRRNVTRYEVKPVARSVPLMGSLAKNIRRERSSGKFVFEVRVKARIRFKVGIMKLRRRTLRVLCSPVVVHMSSSKGFDWTRCDIDL
ncbi:hypothetical protein HHK36_018120 [Tetracentron sinense]|uniref:Late embryogenesis abundant protein LEA-2 subgroup domain-containing protein n=1 Tax=Tetracentron sinense TaxID=13715 RepID=A0A835DD80_TETSI|nr:hypothetical protein HHK36_018120 [Tetracentron sinense]